MSHVRIKTTYQEQNGNWGEVVDKILYAHHNDTCDIVCIYDENGKVIFCFEDTLRNNIMDAITRLAYYWKEDGFKLIDGVEHMNVEDRKKINI